MLKRIKEQAEEKANDPDSLEHKVVTLLLKKQCVTLSEVVSNTGAPKRTALRILARAEKAGKKNPALPQISHHKSDKGDVVFTVESGGFNRAQRRAMR